MTEISWRRAGSGRRRPSDALHGEVGQQVGGLGGGGAADRGALSPWSSVRGGSQEREDQFAARGGVARDLRDGQAGETAGGVGGSAEVAEARRKTVGSRTGADAAQPRHSGDVGAEDAPVGVALRR